MVQDAVRTLDLARRPCKIADGRDVEEAFQCGIFVRRCRHEVLDIRVPDPSSVVVDHPNQHRGVDIVYIVITVIDKGVDDGVPVLPGPINAATPHALVRVYHKIEAGDDAEIGAAAAQGFVKVRVRRRAGGNDATVR